MAYQLAIMAAFPKQLVGMCFLEIAPADLGRWSALRSLAPGHESGGNRTVH